MQTVSDEHFVQLVMVVTVAQVVHFNVAIRYPAAQVGTAAVP